MVFNDTTNLSGLIQECERLCHLGVAGISGTSNLLKEFTSRINEANRIIWTWIFSVNNGWFYDDANQTDLPQASTNLINGTAKYAIPTEALTVKRIEIKDKNGDWYQLKPITEYDLRGIAIDEFTETDGQPIYYRLLGQTIELFPASDYDSTNGLKVYFDRDVVSFISTDTTKTPGFASIFHKALAVGASLDYLKTNVQQNSSINLLAVDWQNYENKIKEFYSKRWQDKQPLILRRKYQNFK